MAELAPNFPHSPGRSSARRLIFVQPGSNATAWALMIDKTDGSRDYRYPLQLILIDRGNNKELKGEHILFTDVLAKPFVSYGSGVCRMETKLLFHLPRSRKLIDFHARYSS
ncbi:hypothetical protein GJV26_28445 [Massilia dura]|uniref:Uncharacterized protein n=1 Tax=Pseudoduganella dura TaxID=321982 RepID=A0A6I3XLI1_9BURK|nr:hypothetical protein [Pseudoduganella dura]MUI16356.1 hypothetical protein [Pseudoduganella dura]GGX86200.1 hypothetical protein GCM10007386_16240 [Pseudoduganella dura]